MLTMSLRSIRGYRPGTGATIGHTAESTDIIYSYTQWPNYIIYTPAASTSFFFFFHSFLILFLLLLLLIHNSLYIVQYYTYIPYNSQRYNTGIIIIRRSLVVVALMCPYRALTRPFTPPIDPATAPLLFSRLSKGGRDPMKCSNYYNRGRKRKSHHLD
jgi:hypothetical protein